MKYLLVLLLSLTVLSSWGQTLTWEDFVEDYLSIDEQQGREALQQRAEQLLYIHENPFDINRITPDELSRLPFVSARQADSLISYIHRYGPLHSLGELSLVPWLDKVTRDRLMLFVYIPDQTGEPLPQVKWRSKPLRQRVAATYAQPLYYRAGFSNYTPEQLAKSPNLKYYGNALALALRYRGSYRDSLEWGLTLQSDEGEPIMSQGNRIFDYQSLYLAGKGRGVLAQWLVGDYQIQQGAGLVAGQGLWNSALAVVSFGGRPRQGIIKHTGTDEIRYFRGAAVTLRLSRVMLTAFVSYRNLDATFSKGYARTLLTSGYHRTRSELDRKGNLHTTSEGLSLQWQSRGLLFGLNGLHTEYNKPFATVPAIYRRYYPKGRSLGNYSAYYQLRLSALSLTGEEAVSERGGVACNNMLRYQPSRRLAVTLQHRYYDKRYQAPYSFAYSLGGHTSNEHGLLAGLVLQPLRKLTLTGYLDYARHPFAIYQATQSSDAMSVHLQADWQLDNDTKLSLRYRVRMKQEDNADSSALLSNWHHYWRIQAYYVIGCIHWVTSADFNLYTPAEGKSRWGRMVSQRMSLNLKAVSVKASAAWFHTADYLTAVRSYEPQMLYSFSFPTCAYHGLRATAIAEVKLAQRLTLSARYTVTHLTNRDHFSSQQQRIDSPTKQDLYFQVVYDF